MPTKLIVTALIVAASGCRMCSDSCDYSPPVAGSPHDGMTSRAGSAFSGFPLTSSESLAPQELPETTAAPIGPQIAP